MQILNKYFILLLFVAVIYGCSGPGGENPGTEFMPDMGHSVAYEANLYDYYYYNTWGSEDEYYQFAQPRKPVANTVARGQAGIGPGDVTGAASMQGYEINGSVPYHYEDTEAERTRASKEIISNPYPITNAGLSRGKALYEINCGICHGNKGDGEGYLVSESNPNAVYPAQPAILTSDTFTYASNGRLYHAIMHGKNVMGGYADKLSYEERWQVIHYIRALQAKNKKLVYDEDINTLDQVSLPMKLWQAAHKSSIETYIEEEYGEGPPAENHMEQGHDAQGHDENGHH
jgi:mono/diheme cytochrome c family protein